MSSEIREHKSEIKMRFELIAAQAKIAILEIDSLEYESLNKVCREISDNINKIQNYNWGR